MPSADKTPSGIPALRGKTALVTGAAKRMGEAIALALADAQAHVVLHYCSAADDAGRVAEKIRSRGGKACCVAADFEDPSAAETLYERAVAEAGPLDFLVNNASIFPESALWEMDAACVRASVNVNALAPFLLARRFAAQDRAVAIVNILDTMIVDYDKKHAAYHLSKRMLYTLTRMMAVEFAPHVRVNAVAPGLVLPPAGEDQAYLERLAHTNLLNRYGAAEDVAEAVLFLLKSGFVTGQVLFVDGGRHLRGNMYG